MKAICLLSGGLDSTVALFEMMKTIDIVAALTIDYMQRHFRELEAAQKIAHAAGVPHIVKRVEAIRLGASALTRSDRSVTDAASTVTPLRNLFFLTVAAVIAQQHGASRVVIGANADDATDYPDCRPAFIDAASSAIRSGLPDHDFAVEAPLLHSRKSDVVRMAHGNPRCWEVVRMTWTCYEPHPPRRGCGLCPACVVRARAFASCGFIDPIGDPA